MTAVFCCLMSEARAQPAESTFNAEYRLTVGDSPIPEGTLWLLYQGYQYFEWYKLADMRAGRMSVTLSSQALKDNEPEPGDTGLSRLIALEVPGSGWYGPQEIEGVADLRRAIDALGASTDSGALRAVDLPPAVPQLLRLQNPDRSPRAGQSVTVWAYETSIGHCARPTGFGAIELTTDINGAASFRSPLRRMYLWAPHFDSKTREEQQGEWLEIDSHHLLSRLWEKEKAVERPVVFTIRKQDGTPAPAEVFAASGWHWDSCGEETRSLGRTDKAGVLTARVAMEDVSEIRIGEDADNNRMYLSEEELAQLRATGHLTVDWPRRKR